MFRNAALNWHTGVLAAVALVFCDCQPVTGQATEHASRPWQLRLRFRTETSADSRRFHTLTREETFDPRRTAIIVCDVWDAHHSINAVRRVEELAPHIDQVLKQSRQAGVTIVHAPSDCMQSYVDHPARKRAITVTKADHVPTGINDWCSRIDAEKAVPYPLDQSDGGEDDDPAEHSAWAKELQSKGRNPGNPWKMQSPLITIDEHRDFISDRGDEVWNILEAHHIDNVILCGVHTNMCVLGRPFGLRNLVAAGKRVVLIRDLTDTMYNPQRWPFVNHHTGTDLIVEYIEKCICPTLTSDQFVGGAPFRFKTDTRPLVAIVMAEDEYETNRTLPQFASDYLGKNFRVALVFSRDDNLNDIPGLEVLNTADVAIVSVRRRPLPKEQMEIIRQFADSGKPLIGIRTASHAFVLRDKEPPEGFMAWPEFDAQVWGGNYTDHFGNDTLPKITSQAENAKHPILTGVGRQPFVAGGSLYKTTPLAKATKVLLTGSIVGHPEEPVAWTFERANGGKSFYTSLGQKDDFDNPDFARLLFNSLVWTTGIEQGDLPAPTFGATSPANAWKVIDVPGEVSAKEASLSAQDKGLLWYRCFIKLDREGAEFPIRLVLPKRQNLAVWVNGKLLPLEEPTDASVLAEVPAADLEFGELNLLVLCYDRNPVAPAMTSVPVIRVGEKEHALQGKWQFCVGADPSFSSLKLPPKFGAGPDVIFDLRRKVDP